MAIIDPEGLFSGERLAACSDMAQLYWPRFFLAANGLARIELSYKSLVSRVFGNFQKIPTSSEIWGIFREYEANFLAVLYESSDGSWWCQFSTSEKFLPKYKKTRDEMSPAPSFEMMEAHRSGYLLWKKSKSFQNQSFQKLSETFSSEGVGIGVGIGVGKEKELSPPASPPAPRVETREKEIIESIFGFYCEKFGKNPKKYQLTEERRKKAGLRFRERLKANDGNEAAVETEFSHAVENLAASDYHVSGDYTDWLAQIFRSQEEFEKRLNWKLGGKSNGRARGNGIFDDLQKLSKQNDSNHDGDTVAPSAPRQTRES